MKPAIDNLPNCTTAQFYSSTLVRLHAGSFYSCLSCTLNSREAKHKIVQMLCLQGFVLTELMMQHILIILCVPKVGERLGAAG